MSGVPVQPTSLLRRVQRLELEMQQLLGLARSLRQSGSVEASDIWLAVTYDNGSYPTASTGHLKVPIRFVDAKFTASEGWESISPTARVASGQSAIAANILADQFVTAGTLVVAWRQRAITGVATSENDGEWWFQACDNS